MPFIGEAIALGTVVCWTCSVHFFAAASQKVGAVPVNIIRISVALLLSSVLLYIREGALIPLHFPLRAWFFLSLSAVVGFFIGDIFLLSRFVSFLFLSICIKNMSLFEPLVVLSPPFSACTFLWFTRLKKERELC